MSLHSYTCCWLHIVFSTLNKEKIINKELRITLSKYFTAYSKERSIFIRTNFVNAEHIHLLIDLPTNMTIEQVIHLYKGSSSNWINKNNFMRGRFWWGRGYGAFSVSQSGVGSVTNYINNQEAHHKVKSFKEEYEELMKAYKMKYRLPG